MEKNKKHPEIPSSKFYLGSLASMVVPSDEWQYVCFDTVQSLLLIFEFVMKWLVKSN